MHDSDRIEAIQFDVVRAMRALNGPGGTREALAALTRVAAVLGVTPAWEDDRQRDSAARLMADHDD